MKHLIYEDMINTRITPKAKDEYNLRDEFLAVIEGMLSKDDKVYKDLAIKSLF